MLVAVGNGSSIAIQDRIQKLGTNTLTVFNRGRFGGGAQRTGTQSAAIQIKDGDISALNDKSQAPDILSASPVVTIPNGTVTYDGASTTIDTLIGSDSEYLTTTDRPVDVGRAHHRQRCDEPQSCGRPRSHGGVELVLAGRRRDRRDDPDQRGVVPSGRRASRQGHQRRAGPRQLRAGPVHRGAGHPHREDAGLPASGRRGVVGGCRGRGAGRDRHDPRLAPRDLRRRDHAVQRPQPGQPPADEPGHQ